MSHFTEEETEALREEVTCLRPNICVCPWDKSCFHCGKRACWIVTFSKRDFLAKGGICILACREANIFLEGRRKTTLAQSGLFFSAQSPPASCLGKPEPPTPRATGSPFQDVACDPSQVTQPPQAVSHPLPEGCLCSLPGCAGCSVGRPQGAWGHSGHFCAFTVCWVQGWAQGGGLRPALAHAMTEWDSPSCVHWVPAFEVGIGF